MLINASRRFPKTALLWQEAEEAAENVKIFSMKSIRDVQETGHSGTCPSLGSVLIVFCIIFAAIIQTTIGTLTTVVINSQVNSSSTSVNGKMFVSNSRCNAIIMFKSKFDIIEFEFFL